MLDRVEIIVKAGDGGHGVVSFRREKFVPFGGPDGGDGGDGGDVIIIADPTVTNLRLLRHRKIYGAGSGGAGKGQKKHGKKGQTLELGVPVGTLVSYKTQLGDGAVIGDLEQPQAKVIVARGGRGGFGNSHFASATEQSPRFAELGKGGEEKTILLELRLLADVGIVGYSNVGKSTLLSAASAARPKIAGYQFTTRIPVLGMVEIGSGAFVLAEIPGLIDGAHLGRGLGHDFLRHVTRTKVILHLVDGTSPSPVEDMMRVNTELILYDSALAAKRQVVAVNKTDLPEVWARRVEIKENFAAVGVGVFFISAATGEGVPGLMNELMRLLGEVAEPEKERETARKVFQPQTRSVLPVVHKEGDTFVVDSPTLERIFARVGDSGLDFRRQLGRQLQRLGIARALIRAGVKPGERVRCGDFEWEWD